MTFVGQAPARTEVRAGRPLVGDSGMLFNAALEEAGIDREEVRVDNAVLCYWYSNQGERPPEEALEACKGHLNSIESEVIVPMGNDALGVLTGQWDGILSASNRIHPDSPKGKKVIPLTHPAYYLRNDVNNFRNFKEGIRFVKRVADGADWSHVGQEVRVIYDRQEAVEFFNWLRDNPPKELVIDLETDYPDPSGCIITSIGLAWDESHGVVVPWSQEYLDKHGIEEDAPLEFEDVYQACKEALEAHPGIDAYNAPFDVYILRREDIQVKLANDVLLMHYALDERVGAQSLKFVGTLYIGMPQWDAQLKRYLKRKDSPYTDIPPGPLFKYQNMDTCGALAVKRVLAEDLELPENEGPKRVYYERLQKWVRMLLDILPIGASMDKERLVEALKVMPVKQMELEKELQELAGSRLFNPRSYLDKRAILFQKFKLPKIKGLSTDKDVLEALEEHPVTVANPDAVLFVQRLREYNQYQKVVGTYLKNMAKSYRNGRGHADLKLFGTVTGRLSANDFNPLVFPRESRGELYATVKEVIVADEDSFLLQADYSGMELRVMAALARDPYMLEVLADPKSDWHATMAQEMYGQEFLDADKDGKKEKRVIAKMLVFGLNYGRGIPSIAAQLGCGREGCKLCERGLKCKRAIALTTELVDKYFDPIPRVRQFREELLREARTTGFLQIPTGRRRRFDLITGDNWHSIEKQIYNFPMQSAGNECNMEAMYVGWTEYGQWVRPLWPIHDAVLWNIKRSIPIDVLDRFLTMLQTVPQEVIGTSLPFYVDVDMGYRWGQLKNVEWEGPGTTKNNTRIKPFLQAD